MGFSLSISFVIFQFAFFSRYVENIPKLPFLTKLMAFCSGLGFFQIDFNSQIIHSYRLLICAMFKGHFLLRNYI